MYEYTSKMVLALLLFSGATVPTRAEQVPPPAASSAEPVVLTEELRKQTFDLVWRTVSEKYYDRTFGGVDWSAIGEEFRPYVIAAADHATFHARLSEMVKRLGGSHLSVAPPPLPDSPYGAVLTSIGADLVAGGERAFIERVEAGGPADRQGLRPGDEIIAIDGVSVAARNDRIDQPFWLAVHRKLVGAAGSDIALTLRRGSEEREVRLQRAASGSHGKFASSEFEKLDDQTGLLKIDTFMLDPTPAIELMKQSCQACSRLVIDLRGNGGGAMSNLLKLLDAVFLTRNPVGMIRNQGGTEMVYTEGSPDAFSGDVHVLIDGRGASSSEVFAAAVQDAGRGVVHGSASAGAVILSYVEKLPTGGSLLYPASEFRRPSGVALEGVSVIPDKQIIPSSDELARGHDAVLQSARADCAGQSGTT